MAKKGRRRQDHFTRRAQSQGFPARSVYKLEAIDRRYGVLKKGMRVLDLGAAPGSWSIYCSRRIGTDGIVCAVDLSDFAVAVSDHGAPVEIVRGDLSSEETAARVSIYAPFGLVLSDAAPATTGNRIVDTARSEGIVEAVVARLDRWLGDGGACVCKIFQGGGEQRLLADMRVRFEHAHAFRPEAVRSESFESYLIGIGFRPGTSA